MKYEAKTFFFRDKCDVGPTDEDKDTGIVVQDSPPESIVLERVKTFANEMLGQDEEIDEKNSDTNSERQEDQLENVTDPAPTDHEELMRSFKSVAIYFNKCRLVAKCFEDKHVSRESRQGKHQGLCE